MGLDTSQRNSVCYITALGVRLIYRLEYHHRVDFHMVLGIGERVHAEIPQCTCRVSGPVHKLGQQECNMKDDKVLFKATPVTRI